MKMIISHPTSNQFNRSVLNGLLKNKVLAEYHTSVASFPGGILYQMGGANALSELRRRSFQPELRKFTSTSPLLECGRLVAGKLNLSMLTSHETGLFCVDSVYRQLDKKVSNRLKKGINKNVRSVYAYEDGALYTFRKAHELGLNCFYDLPIGYWRAARKLLSIEKERWPEWSATLTGLQDSEAKLKRKDEELALADRIFVASSFTAKTLDEYPGKLAPVEVIPYGFPKPVAHREYLGFGRKRPLKLLFVGGLSQRKGIADVFSVADKFQSNVSLTVVGYKASNNCKVLDQNLAKHTWIPSLPHSKILELMKNQDVLIFPSHFEGFGMVITEAMSQGTPVITTNRTAGPDFINHGENGWLVEAGSTLALEECIESLLQNPEMISKAGKAARETAGSRPWDVYGSELVNAIQQYQK